MAVSCLTVLGIKLAWHPEGSVLPAPTGTSAHRALRPVELLPDHRGSVVSIETNAWGAEVVNISILGGCGGQSRTAVSARKNAACASTGAYVLDVRKLQIANVAVERAALLSPALLEGRRSQVLFCVCFPIKRFVKFTKEARRSHLAGIQPDRTESERKTLEAAFKSMPQCFTPTWTSSLIAWRRPDPRSACPTACTTEDVRIWARHPKIAQ